MYILEFLEDFGEQFKKLVKGNLVLKKQFEKALNQLSQDPFYPSLKSHKVATKKHQNVWSSSVSGDVRVIWTFDKNENLVILILETGTHSGSNKIYNKKS